MIRFHHILIIVAALLPYAATALTDEQAEVSQVIMHKIFQESVREVSVHRNNCMAGLEPTAKDGFDKSYLVDICVATLNRIASDNRLPDLYKGLLTRLHVDDDSYVKKLPGLIGAAAYKHKTAVIIDGRQLQVTPGLAFDAGFTMGYETTRPTPETIGEDQMRSLAQTCLGGGGNADIKTCTAIGTFYGARAHLVYQGDTGN